MIYIPLILFLLIAVAFVFVISNEIEARKTYRRAMAGIKRIRELLKEQEKDICGCRAIDRISGRYSNE